MLRAGELNRPLLIEYPVTGSDPDYGTKKITWAPLSREYGSVTDILMSARGGGETVVHGDLRVLVRPCRIVIRYRSTITAAMRVTLLDENRLMQIVSIAEMGRKVGLELQCEQFSS
jgi:head-tail adaptor